MSNNQKPEPKQYSLTVHEANMLRFVNNHQNAIFSGLLSTIAGSRLGYTVTERTQFQLSGDFATMTLMELEVPAEAKAAQAPADDGGSPVVTAPETAKEAQSEPSTDDSNSEAPNDVAGGEDNATSPDAEPAQPEPSQPSNTENVSVNGEGQESAEGQPTAELKPEAPAETTTADAPAEPKSETQAS